MAGLQPKYCACFFAPILTKLFNARIELILCGEISYSKHSCLFTDQQNDFRTNQSCETALHSILDIC